MKTTIKTAILSIATYLSLCANAQVTINETNFPDDIFRQYVKRFDTDNNGKLSKSEINAVTSIKHIPDDIDSRIKDATGIEHFTSLTSLDFCYEDISEINLTSLTKLDILNTEYCQLTDIDLSENKNLTSLVINAKKISSLDLSQNTKLEKITIRNSTLTSYSKDYNSISTSAMSPFRSQVFPVKLNYDAPLTHLYIYDVNVIGSGIDFTKLVNLESVSLSQNNITQIDLTKCVKLYRLYMYANKISSIDLSKNTELTELYISSSRISTLDLTHNTKLKMIFCDFNNLTDIDISKLTQLEKISFYCNKLTDIDVSQHPNLTYLDVSNNSIPALELSNNPLLKDLFSTTYITISTPSSQGVSFDDVDITRVSNIKGGSLIGNRFIPSGEMTTNNAYTMTYNYDTKAPNNKTPLKVNLTFTNIDNTTPLDDVTDNNKPAKSIKTIENGRLVIIRNGQKYDLNGRKL